VLLVPAAGSLNSGVRRRKASCSHRAFEPYEGRSFSEAEMLGSGLRAFYLARTQRHDRNQGASSDKMKAWKKAAGAKGSTGSFADAAKFGDSSSLRRMGSERSLP